MDVHSHRPSGGWGWKGAPLSSTLRAGVAGNVGVVPMVAFSDDARDGGERHGRRH